MNKPKRHPFRGFSLIELLVSIAMGLALLLVILTLLQSMTSNSRLGQTQQRMSEDAQQAFQILGLELRQAGFNPRQARTSSPTSNSLNSAAGESAMPIFGCSSGFTNGVGAGSAAHIGLLTCNAAASGTETFAVQYEADRYSNNVTSAASTPADCRGFAVPLVNQALTTAAGASAGNASYYLVENRYFVSSSGLSCSGNGTGGTTPFDSIPQPLVRNIERMELKYGLTQANPNATTTKYVSGYLLANEIGPGSGNADYATVDASLSGANPAYSPSNRWAKLVKTVRVCLTVRGDSPVLSQDLTPNGATPTYGYYYGCSPEGANAPIAITDRFPRRSFFMHYALRSRLTVQ